MPSSIKIQRAKIDQLPDIIKLLSTQFLEHHVEISDSSITTALRGMIDDFRLGFCLVAECDNKCIGVAYVSFVWALEHGGHAAWLEEIYVEPKHRGRVGIQLLDAVVAECIANGCAAIDGEIDPDNIRLSSLYGRIGCKFLLRLRIVKRLVKI